MLSGQLHAPGKNHLAHCTGASMGPRAGVDTCGHVWTRVEKRKSLILSSRPINSTIMAFDIKPRVRLRRISYIHTYIIHTFIHTYTYIHTFIHTYTYIHTYIHTYILRKYVHTYIHTYLHTYIHTYIQTYIDQQQGVSGSPLNWRTY
jgi:hypothetical protein